MQIRKFTPRNGKAGGFTLLELCLVLIIMAPLLITAVSAYTIYLKAMEQEKSERLMVEAKRAIDGFLLVPSIGRYPCPASDLLPPTDPNYGVEAINLTTGECDGTVLAIPGERDVDGDGDKETVYIGTMPYYVFDSFGKKFELSYFLDKKELVQTNFLDPWKQPLRYAVTGDLAYRKPTPTSTPRFDPEKGAIRIVDEYNRDTGGTKSDAHYVVFSRGENQGLGCSAGYTLENQNCNGSPQNAIFLSSPLYKNANNIARYYDDLLTYGLYHKTGVWAGVIGTTNIYNDNSGNVGIKTPARTGDTAPKEKLDVNGDVLAKVNTGAQLLCEEDSASGVEGPCVDPASLYSLSCPAPMYIVEVKIVSNKLTPVCKELEFQPPTGGGTCSTSLRGIYTDGAYKCS